VPTSFKFKANCVSLACKRWHYKGGKYFYIFQRFWIYTIWQ
jgi:hypothetical protein